MARKPADGEQVPVFTPETDIGTISRRYHIHLITPMAGGGAKSWEPDINQPIRSQSVKGQLRFWWRTMQIESTPHGLLNKERALWGGPGSGGDEEGQASSVKLQIVLTDRVTPQKNVIEYLQNDGVLPDYVLFPMVPRTSKKLLKDLQFELKLTVPQDHQTEVENSVKLWLLFGGLGARVTRGCGSLYCEEVMTSFQNGDSIVQFLHGLRNTHPEGNRLPGFGTAPYPSIINSRLAVSSPINTDFPQNIWNNFLSSFGDFRQRPGIGRNRGAGRTPGRTYWPEADALRRITNNRNPRHEPVHSAGNWFPRGAYGLPIQTEFRNGGDDPEGKFFLQPKGKERWPSPVILKVVQLNNNTCIKICLILNHAVPDKIELLKGQRSPHDLAPNEHPMAYDGKTMPPEAGMLHSSENPYDALIRHLDVEEVTI